MQSETDPLRFLRHHGYNPFAAARRIVLYWEYRRKIFGEKWLHPMALGETGALSEEDNQLLQSGWIAVIQKPPTPTVIILDSSKLTGDFTSSIIRTVFYLSTVANHAEAKASNPGITILNSIDRRPFVSHQLIAVLLKMLKRAFPIKISMILCVKFETSTEGGSSGELNTKEIWDSVTKVLGSDMLKLIKVKEESQACEYIEAYGIPKHCVPVDFGGEWTYDQILDWQQYATVATRAAPVPTSSLLHSVDGSVPDHIRENELARARNALYSRRAYQRRKAKQTSIEEEKRAEEAINMRLKEENRRLQSLLDEANAIIRSLKTDKS